jgi:hypothetical protein
MKIFHKMTGAVRRMTYAERRSAARRLSVQRGGRHCLIAILERRGGRGMGEALRPYA